MNCSDYQNQILQSLDEGLRPEEQRTLESHRRQCAACQEFYRVQAWLDTTLTAEHEAPALSNRFRIRLKRQMQREARAVWREYLPEVLHVTGCLAMIGLGIGLLPLLRRALPFITMDTGLFLSINLAFLGATTFLWSLFQLWLEEMTD